MTRWARTGSALVRRCMGAVLVHNDDGEPVILREALVLVWDALEAPRTEEELCAAIAARAPGSPRAEVTEVVHRAVGSLEQVGLATRRE